MTMKIDPKTNKVTYSDPKKVEAFADKLAQTMVEGLNKEVLKNTSKLNSDEQKLKEFENSPLWAKIKKSLDEQSAISSKFGFDIKKHWQDMLAFLKK